MKVFCNPLNLDYRYQFLLDDKVDRLTVNREAADPSLILFQGRYYLFASMSLGVWVSEDLTDWCYHPLPSTLPLYDYAPDARVLGDWVYLSASASSHNCNFYRTKNILEGPYEEITGSFPFWDPNLFVDKDGRVYFFWGCSNVNPIYGVELDAKTMKPLSDPVGVIFPDAVSKGFERVGENNLWDKSPRPAAWIEGPWLDRIGDCYYLQYAAPGTQFNTYCDGVYVSDHPLGPYRLAENNPYSLQPGGFIRGAGHGSTLEDLHGNRWHTSTMRISVNHMFERRIGLWPAGIDDQGELFCNQRYGDWPREVTAQMDPLANPLWMLLSYGATPHASSEAAGHAASNATDEDICTWWKADAKDENPWLEIDLGTAYDVHAIQINFADDQIEAKLPEPIHNTDAPRTIDSRNHVTRWLLEGALEQGAYEELCDKRKADTNLPHDLVVIETGKKIRYLRLSAMEIPFGQAPCVSGLRVFGFGQGSAPEVPRATVTRSGALDLDITMQADGAIGYNVLWGSTPQTLYHSYLTFEEHCHIGTLVAGQSYVVRVDAFNVNGITEGLPQEIEKR